MNIFFWKLIKIHLKKSMEFGKNLLINYNVEFLAESIYVIPISPRCLVIELFIYIDFTYIYICISITSNLWKNVHQFKKT